MKYTVGQKLKVEMRDGFHLSEIVQRKGFRQTCDKRIIFII